MSVRGFPHDGGGGRCPRSPGVAAKRTLRRTRRRVMTRALSCGLTSALKLERSGERLTTPECADSFMRLSGRAQKLVGFLVGSLGEGPAQVLMSRPGIEPGACGLKVRCSTN